MRSVTRSRSAASVALLLASASPWVHAFSSGSGSCTNVVPPHFPLGSGNGGLALVAPASYQPGQTLAVTLTAASPPSFKGLLLWAEDSAALRTGSWQVPSGYQLATALNCPGSQTATLTHSNANTKSVPVSFNWTAPATDVGPVTLRALVALNLTQAFLAAPVTIAGDHVLSDGFENPPAPTPLP